jgi:hypothetical protein
MEDEYLKRKALAVGNLGAKNIKLTQKLMDAIEKIPTLSIKQIDQLSSTFDQMTKIVNDIMEDK